MALDALRGYVQIANGLTDVTRQRAVTTARQLLEQGGGIVDQAVSAPVSRQVQGIAEELLATSRMNRDLLVGLIRSEVDRAVARLGLVGSDELAAVVARLQRQVDRRLSDPLPADDEGFAPPVTVPSPTTAMKAPAKKAPAKKVPAKKAPAKKAPAKKAPAKKVAAKKAPAKKAAPTEPPVPIVPPAAVDPALEDAVEQIVLEEAIAEVVREAVAEEIVREVILEQVVEELVLEEEVREQLADAAEQADGPDVDGPDVDGPDVDGPAAARRDDSGDDR